MYVAAARKSLGEQGEEIARDFLKKKHFEIIARNWRPAKQRSGGIRGEVDIVAKDPNDSQIVFVEVKTLREPNTDDLSPEHHFTYKKFSKLKQLSQLFMIENGMSGAEYRIDVITVAFVNGRYEVRHYEGVAS